MRVLIGMNTRQQVVEQREEFLVLAVSAIQVNHAFDFRNQWAEDDVGELEVGGSIRAQGRTETTESMIAAAIRSAAFCTTMGSKLWCLKSLRQAMKTLWSSSSINGSLRRSSRPTRDRLLNGLSRFKTTTSGSRQTTSDTIFGNSKVAIERDQNPIALVQRPDLTLLGGVVQYDFDVGMGCREGSE